MPRGGVTQTRTFVYDPVTWRLSSATNPETGTVNYLYNSDGSLFRKTDGENRGKPGQPELWNDRCRAAA